LAKAGNGKVSADQEPGNRLSKQKWKTAKESHKTTIFIWGKNCPVAKQFVWVQFDQHILAEIGRAKN